MIWNSIIKEYSIWYNTGYTCTVHIVNSCDIVVMHEVHPVTDLSPPGSDRLRFALRCSNLKHFWHCDFSLGLQLKWYTDLHSKH